MPEFCVATTGVLVPLEATPVVITGTNVLAVETGVDP